MNDAAPRTFEAMANRPTAYAIDLIIDGEEARRISFTASKTKRNLLWAASDNGEEIAALMTEDELDMAWTYAPGVLSFAAGRIQLRFGKTERDIASELLRAA